MSTDKIEYDPEYLGFVKYLFSSKTGIRTRGAIEVGRRAVDYFRGVEFVRWMQRNAIVLKSTFPELMNKLDFNSLDDIRNFGTELIRKSFILKAEYKPVGTNVTKGMKQPKWPRRLSVTANQVFDENFFYIIIFESHRAIYKILMVSILLSVVAIFMFPAWPLAIKISVWYISVVLLSLMLSIFFIRLVAFALFWFFGFDIWILPNLFDEERGVIDSFRPLYSVLYRQDDWFMLIIRIFCAIFLTGAIYQLSKTHSATDVGHFARQSFLDVLDWGYKKIAPPEDMSPTSAGNPLDRNMKQKTMQMTPELVCITKCLRFESKDALLEDCCSGCQCISELLGLPCLSSKNVCPVSLLQELMDMQKIVCINQDSGTQDIEGEL
ncbi:putative translocation protein Sec62 [Cryptosporidium serpentis]